MSALAYELNAAAPSENPYELTREHAVQLTAELLEDRPPIGEDRFVCYMVDGNDRFANIGRQIESEVFMAAFQNGPEQMQEEYGPYEAQSKFFLSIDRENSVPTGVLRIMENGPAGLKTLNDLADPGKNPEQQLDIAEMMRYHSIGDLDTSWDYGTVAVPPEYRSGEGSVSVQLYRGSYLAAMEEGVEHVFSVIDDRAHSKLTSYLGIPFVPLSGMQPMTYLGSEKSHPVYGYVPKFYEKMNRKRYTLKGLLARNVLSRLVKGSQDSEIQFKSRYKK